jgi:hypothetical protein
LTGGSSCPPWILLLLKKKKEEEEEEFLIKQKGNLPKKNAWQNYKLPFERLLIHSKLISCMFN